MRVRERERVRVSCAPRAAPSVRASASYTTRAGGSPPASLGCSVCIVQVFHNECKTNVHQCKTYIKYKNQYKTYYGKPATKNNRDQIILEACPISP